MADDDSSQYRVYVRDDHFAKMDMLSFGDLSTPEMLRDYLGWGYMMRLRMLGADTPAEIVMMDQELNELTGVENPEAFALDLVKSIKTAHNLDNVTIEDADSDDLEDSDDDN